MKVLVLHNCYRSRGGEDIVAQAEVDLLRSRGVDVFSMQTPQAEGGSRVGELVQLVRSTAWSKDSYENVRRVCAAFRPDVAHVHNFWMRLSPSVLKACHDSGVATVQSLHNFRLLCTNALLLRNGSVCEDCVGKLPWRGVVRRCYRDSFLASGAVARMIVENRHRGTWERDVDAFIALSEHSRQKFLRAALPAERIFVKPNFVADPGPPKVRPSELRDVLYAGRLSREKGVDVLLAAWAAGDLGRYGTLLIAGDGPDRDRLRSRSDELRLSESNVQFLGSKTHEEVLQLIARSRVVVQPSICYETFGVTVAEAFAAARPAVVSDRAALNELVKNHQTGLCPKPGDHLSLMEALRTVLVDGHMVDEMGENARKQYAAAYTPDANYEILSRIYEFAIDRRRRVERTTGVAVPAHAAGKPPAGVPVLQGRSLQAPGQ